MIKISVITSLFRSEKYLENYLHSVCEIKSKENVEVLLLINEPSQTELDIVNPFLHNNSFLKLIKIPQRESLYTTWNRGIKLSQGEYCAIWNVDDIRTPDSLLLQSEMLDAHPESAMTYGNYILMKKYGDLAGELVIDKDVKDYPHEAYRSHIVGCFPMWRKTIHDKIGYFDEQFRLVADYEFQIRTAYNYPLIKTNHLLGYFLQGEGDEGRLSQHSNTQNEERTAVEIRYGIYDKVNLLYSLKARKHFRINEILSCGLNHDLNDYISIHQIKKNYFQYLISLFQLPLNIARYIKHLY